MLLFFAVRSDENAAVTAALLSPSYSLAASHASDVLDMPVDPNEPTYCLCHQVSYGEMIGCDNIDVSLVTLLNAQSSADLRLCRVNAVLIGWVGDYVEQYLSECYAVDEKLT